jgi:ATP-dependent exoDNAse (exonuclease V) alpha subunit
MEFNLNSQQQEAAGLIEKWFETVKETKKQVFVLSGYAGTGKTFLINIMIEKLGLKPSEVAFGTPTGKAASVLIQRGRDASTIHRMIYTPMDEEYEQRVGENTIRSHRVKFVKKDAIPDHKLIVLDEVSMVDEKMMGDLLSFGIPILATGDPGQLPPIQGENPLIKKPDYFLTEIVRQSMDNPIVRLATMARNKERIPYGNFGTVLVLDRRAITPENLKTLLLGADQIICGTNSSKVYLNNEVRKMKGIDVIKKKHPIDGDKIMCTVNNWDIYLDEDMQFNLVNGTIGTASGCEVHDRVLNIGTLSFSPDFLEGVAVSDLLFDSGVFLNDEYTFDMHQRALVLPENRYKLKKYFSKKAETESHEEFQSRIMEMIRDSREAVEEKMINRFEYAYAISCHKSQGSEFDKVVVFDEGHIFGDSSHKWLYTAITRAKNRLVIIR